MPLLHRASWVLPIVRPPIRDGWVLVDRGQIVAMGGPGDPPAFASRVRVEREASARPRRSASGRQTRGGGGPRDLGSGGREPRAILPGLVNAHTHLELSWMRDQVPPAASMPAWAARLIERRRAVGHDAAEPIVDAINEMRASGTTLVGEVSNSLASYDALADSNLSVMLFRELIGFNPVEPRKLVADAHAQLSDLTPLAWIRTNVVPHAPYSVSEDLFKEIAAAAGDRPITLHLGESVEEVEFLSHGTGAWLELLKRLGLWSDERRRPPCNPVEFIEKVGLLNDRLLAVHCVQLGPDELDRLAKAGATVVTCPRSNAWTGAGTPPIERFYESGVRVAIGTDSLASVDDVNMFNEIRAVRTLAPRVPASRILKSATLDGAEALGFGSELGSIEPGKRAELIAVRVPDGVVDVEEYLVAGGITPAAVRWVDAECTD